MCKKRALTVHTRYGHLMKQVDSSARLYSVVGYSCTMAAVLKHHHAAACRGAGSITRRTQQPVMVPTSRTPTTTSVQQAQPCTSYLHTRSVQARGIPVSGPGSTPEVSGAPAGQISSTLVESMRAKIAEELEAQTVVVQDVYGDGRHVSIDVVSPLFEGKNPVQRQRMVYKAIWLELQEAVHAVDAMTTKTPSEAQA